MKWIDDDTGRFIQRPWFEEGELDDRCETLIVEFLRDRHGAARYPISTDNLTVLVERHASDLDLYADLSVDGETVEGVTVFLGGRRPEVRIDKKLSTGEQVWSGHRLRTTLTHELGHVIFHAPLMPSGQLPLFGGSTEPYAHRCRRDSILGGDRVDWMEWQARYACGAFLMPSSEVERVVSAVDRPFGRGSKEADSLVRQVQSHFDVSRYAAEVRLSQLGHLKQGDPERERRWF